MLRTLFGVYVALTMTGPLGLTLSTKARHIRFRHVVAAVFFGVLWLPLGLMTLAFIAIASWQSYLTWRRDQREHSALEFWSRHGPRHKRGGRHRAVTEAERQRSTAAAETIRPHHDLHHHPRVP